MAKKKDFTQNDKAAGIDLIRTVASKKASDTKDTANIKDVSDTKEEYRFSARFTPTQWKFITEKKWQTRKSITQILQDYVNEDIKKHPELLEGIDELNG